MNDTLRDNIKTLNEILWEGRINNSVLDKWLNNFLNTNNDADINEQYYALHLLSQFMYFGAPQIRELLKAMYVDLYRYPIIYGIRRSNANTIDLDFIEEQYGNELDKTKFIGMGNPSESGSHLLYYFRQENELATNLFIHSHEIFKRDGDQRTIKNEDITRYVFIDDFCGSGKQASDYSRDLLVELKNISVRKSKTIVVSYLVLFGCTDGLDKVRKETLFDQVECVFELDESYQCFSDKSLYFIDAPSGITREHSMEIALKYGNLLWPNHPLGYSPQGYAVDNKGGQFLIGFHHNTPDNTLPIIWHPGNDRYSWTPAFKRYHKMSL